jgi:hypothetical protein
MTDHGGLLHNMSSPPRSVVSYNGLGVSVPRGTVPEDASVGSRRASKLFGTAIRFVLPVGLAHDGPKGLLHQLDGKKGPDLEDKFRELIEQRADELPLPDGCLVIPVEPAHQMVWSDTLTALTILSKCSATVWLRAKTPSLRAALARQRASLLVPPTFIDKLPKEET